MQPEWRPCDLDDGSLVQEGVGEWLKLQRPGKNGMLLVLLSLWWWRAHPAADAAEWATAVDDVLWVLRSLLQLARAKCSREEGSEPEAPPVPKRRRKSGRS